MKPKAQQQLDIAFGNFKQEAELFFVKPLISSEIIKRMYSDCLDIMYNLTGKKDCGRGIIAFNTKYGQGKSFFFDVVNHRHRRKYGNNLSVRITAKDLCEIYKTAGKGEDPQTKLERFINVQRLFIDDIGEEIKDGVVSSHYANKLNVIRHVLLKRYELWTDKGWITDGTTNLSINDIGKHYDGRVADRLLQMSYWKEFKFLGEGSSFRQIESTRKLTQTEIEESWKKITPKKEVEKIDLEKYFNELIDEEDSFFEHFAGWSFAKKYLIKKGLLNEDQLKNIDRNSILRAGVILKKEVKATKRSEFIHTKHHVRVEAVRRGVEAITDEAIRDHAENIVAKKTFMKLRKSKHVFE